MIDFIHNCQVFWVIFLGFFGSETNQKMHIVLIGVYVFVSFFFVQFLVFERWWILYSTMVNSKLGTLTSEATVFNPKACGVQGYRG